MHICEAHLSIIVARFLDAGNQAVTLSRSLVMESERETITEHNHRQYKPYPQPEKPQP